MMRRRINESGLRLTVGAVFLALLFPTLLLVTQAYRQLEREAYFQVRAGAEQLSRQIDQHLAALVSTEDARGIVDYRFLSATGDGFAQRSPLSGFPVASPVPGVKSYFQIDAGGILTTPLLPAADDDSRTYGMTPGEYRQRLDLQDQVTTLLGTTAGGASELDEAEVAERDAPRRLSADNAAPKLDELGARAGQLDGQRVIENLEETAQSKAANALGRVEDLKLDAPYSLADAAAPEIAPVARRAPSPAPASEPRRERMHPTIDIDSFTSAMEPFRFVLLDAGHFMLYRTVWQDGARSIQGMVMDREDFLRDAVQNVFARSELSTANDLIVAYQGELLQAYSSPGREYFVSADQVTGTLLYRTALGVPFNDLELIYFSIALPVSPGSALIMWTAAALVIVLLAGFWLIYRLGLQQINAHRQQQDFVSAVSHELKTPITSIRMYGEILKAGWASEDKKRGYYDFIFQESERLSRLINNVLQLARFTRNGTDVNLQPVPLGELLDVLRSKVATQIEQAGFELAEAHADDSLVLMSDVDAFSQIVINLVDNAIKFSAKGDPRRIELSSRATRDGEVEISIRDHGPGIPREQLKKVFELFYRTERELTRETMGTGIGLALVRELVTAMGGKISVHNAGPGAVFRMRFPLHHD